MSPGQLTLGLSTAWMPMHVVHETHCPDIGPICLRRDEPPHLHDQTFQVFEARLITELGLTSNFSVEAQVPLRMTGVRIVYRRLDGSAFVPDWSDIHHRNETLAGLGDPWLLVRGATTVAGFELRGRLGLSLPVGRTERNPFALAALGLEHQHVQFGTGTFNPLATAEVSKALGHLTFLGSGQAFLPLAQNQHGFRAGVRVGLGVGTEVAFLERFRAAITLDVLHEGPERWDGVVQQDGNLGRTDVLAGAGFSAQLGRLSLSLAIKSPIFQHFVQTEDDHASLRSPIFVAFRVQGTVFSPSPNELTGTSK